MAEAKQYLIKNGTIIDVEKGESFLGSIEIEGTKIKRMYKVDERLPENLQIIDANGMYIIPGLIDMHCHIQCRFAPHFLASGVTTVRNPASNVMMIEDLLIAPLDAATPRVFSADRMIDGEPGLWGPTSYGNFVTEDPEEARVEVRRQAATGVNFIKIYGLANREVIQATVEEARKFDLEVACDLIHSQKVSALEAAELGVTWFEHASGFVQSLYPGWYPTADQAEWSHIDWENPDEQMIKELCKQMLQYEVKLCPTLVCFDQAKQYPTIWSPENLVTRSLEEHDILMSHWQSMEQHVHSIKQQFCNQHTFTKLVTKSYFDLGGTVVAGTDTPALLYTFPGMALHRELELFREIGLTEMETLQAATIRAAQSIYLENIGAIKEGYIADLVILNENPLEAIEHTKSIHRIVKGGRVYSQEEVLTYIQSNEESEVRMVEFQSRWEEEMSKVEVGD
ncbi:amidohydrolase family protein [Sporosarcina saromensis]|uniref:Amidohydrolase family protein n=1 Tax=Sporosarcina saromensis TaxID=359365 RepID=A0ABU4G915_9BACL|nr:amidohydrolase family protein [Sporosarcina saromensis]MDW0113469.1 amidohydrolase family protein [Sporosarcina saromensis]